MRVQLLLAAAGGLACLAAPAHADGVRFDRAALADPAAAAAFEDAVEQEAERVCRKAYDRLSVLGSTTRRRAVETCITDTVQTAMQSVRQARTAEQRPAGAQVTASRE